MNKIIITLFTCLFSFGFAQETHLDEYDVTTAQNEMEKLSEQKKALNEMYNELTDEQKASLDEEFQAQIDELNKKIETLVDQTEE